MEYIEGTDIEDWFENCSMGLSTASLNDIFIQLIDAFDYLQKHDIIHRDIRESNILIDKDDVVKVIDFGIGKVILPGSTIKDSLYEDINRANSDTLPSEYYSGTYTSSTDMFYLAELINRLLNTYPCPDFRYQHIIDKMMSKKSEDRYSSFSEIKYFIEQSAFSSLSISVEEKQIYLNFADSLNEVIGVYTESPIFNSDCSSIISKLETVLSNNLFENFISNNADIINVFVNVYFTFDNEYGISVDTVRSFVEWLKSSTPSKRNIIVSNIINKISNKEVDVFAIDPPF
jgi:serine/threonine-protein kinase